MSHRNQILSDPGCQGIAVDVKAPTNERLVTLVDDEPAALDVLVRAARAFHFDSQTAACAEQALTVLEDRLTPLVVTDLRMPGQGGLWLVREIRRRWPEVAVLV